MFRTTILTLLAAAGFARGELKFDKPVQEFHRVPADGHVDAHFTFKNTGNDPVTVRRVRTS